MSMPTHRDTFPASDLLDLRKLKKLSPGRFFWSSWLQLTERVNALRLLNSLRLLRTAVISDTDCVKITSDERSRQEECEPRPRNGWKNLLHGDIRRIPPNGIRTGTIGVLEDVDGGEPGPLNVILRRLLARFCGLDVDGY